jgi:hypothetical protein
MPTPKGMYAWAELLGAVVEPVVGIEPKHQHPHYRAPLDSPLSPPGMSSSNFVALAGAVDGVMQYQRTADRRAMPPPDDKRPLHAMNTRPSQVWAASGAARRQSLKIWRRRCSLWTWHDAI